MKLCLHLIDLNFTIALWVARTDVIICEEIKAQKTYPESPKRKTEEPKQNPRCKLFSKVS